MCLVCLNVLPGLLSSYKEKPRWTHFSDAIGRAEGPTLIPGQFANKAGFSAALMVNLEFLLCLAQQCGNFVLWVLCQVGIFVGISGLFLFGAFPSKVPSGVKRGLFPKSSGSCPSVSSVCWWAGTPVIWFFHTGSVVLGPQPQVSSPVEWDVVGTWTTWEEAWMCSGTPGTV